MRSFRELVLILPAAAVLFLLLSGAVDENRAKRAVCAEHQRVLVRTAHQ